MYLIGLNIGVRERLQLGGRHSIQESSENMNGQHKIRSGVAIGLTYSVNTGRSMLSRVQAMNFLRSVLLMPPIGLTSALEQLRVA